MEYRITIPARAKGAAKTNRDMRTCWYVVGETPDKARAAFRQEYGKRLKLHPTEVLDVEVPTGNHWVLAVSKAVHTRVTTYDDSQFIRTALVITHGGEGGSVDVVDGAGKRLCQINLFLGAYGSLIVDVDDRFAKREAITFPTTKTTKRIKAGAIVSADFKVKGCT